MGICHSDDPDLPVHDQYINAKVIRELMLSDNIVVAVGSNPADTPGSLAAL